MAQSLTIELIELKNNPDFNVVIGQSHFIKTVEDIHELMVSSVPHAAFGLAFCEASGERLIRTTGTDKALEQEAVRMAQLIGAGHTFVLVMKDMFPINVLPQLKAVPEVVTLFCATANSIQVMVGVSHQGRGIVGVIDGGSPSGVEKDLDVDTRKAFLRQIGYKL